MQLIPKPSREAQAEVGGAKQVPLSDVYATLKRRLWTNRSWEKVDIMYSAFMLVIHGLCLFAPVTFSWPMVGLFFGSYFVTGAPPNPSALYLADLFSFFGRQLLALSYVISNLCL